MHKLYFLFFFALFSSPPPWHTYMYSISDSLHLTTITLYYCFLASFPGSPPIRTCFVFDRTRIKTLCGFCKGESLEMGLTVFINHSFWWTFTNLIPSHSHFQNEKMYHPLAPYHCYVRLQPLAQIHLPSLPLPLILHSLLVVPSPLQIRMVCRHDGGGS